MELKCKGNVGESGFYTWRRYFSLSEPHISAFLRLSKGHSRFAVCRVTTYRLGTKLVRKQEFLLISQLDTSYGLNTVFNKNEYLPTAGHCIALQHGVYYYKSTLVVTFGFVSCRGSLRATHGVRRIQFSVWVRNENNKSENRSQNFLMNSSASIPTKLREPLKIHWNPEKMPKAIIFVCALDIY